MMDPTVTMDPTLLQIMRRLFWAEQEIDRLRAQNGQLQADYTDVAAELATYKAAGQV